MKAETSIKNFLSFDGDHISVVENALIVVINVHFGKSVTQFRGKKGVILDVNRKVQNCYEGLCHGCHLKDEKRLLEKRHIGCLNECFAKGKRSNPIHGFIEYFMSKGKAALSLYAPEDYDLKREVYDGTPASCCVNNHSNLTNYRMVYFEITNNKNPSTSDTICNWTKIPNNNN